MSTTYPGREDHHDLGNGHSFVWLTHTAAVEPVGIIEHHPAPSGNDELYCSGYVAWVVPDGSQLVAKHQLVSREPLTIAPSLACRRCPSHGFIQEGRWVDA